MSVQSLLHSLCGIVLFCSLYAGNVPSALSASKATCPDKVLDSNTISGTYLGSFEAEEGLHSIGIQVSAESEPIYIPASEADAKKFFGEGIGQKISVTYKLEQAWFASTQECLRIEILTDGEVIAQAASSGTGAKNAGRKVTFIYQQKGYSGQLTLSPYDPLTRKVPISIATYNESGNMCEFEGSCDIKDMELICTNVDIKNDLNNFIAITVLKYGLELRHEYSGICGIGVSLSGIYMQK